MNHVMYADVCLLAPSTIGLQRMLNVCIDFSIRNDIKFNSIKSVCVVFKTKLIGSIVQLCLWYLCCNYLGIPVPTVHSTDVNIGSICKH